MLAPETLHQLEIELSEAVNADSSDLVAFLSEFLRERRRAGRAMKYRKASGAVSLRRVSAAYRPRGQAPARSCRTDPSNLPALLAALRPLFLPWEDDLPVLPKGAALGPDRLAELEGRVCNLRAVTFRWAGRSWMVTRCRRIGNGRKRLIDLPAGVMVFRMPGKLLESRRTPYASLQDVIDILLKYQKNEIRNS